MQGKGCHPLLLLLLLEFRALLLLAQQSINPPKSAADMTAQQRYRRGRKDAIGQVGQSFPFVTAYGTQTGMQVQH
jgi:hypothetical protein